MIIGTYTDCKSALSGQSGAVVEKRIFDAWGAIAKVQDGTGKTLNGLTVLDRGYTGHEHLQSVGLINMNARLYDPKLHSFLQPDNNIQDPFNSQNYNRYGYVLNNPLKYTDESGEFWQFAAVALAAYIYGGAATGEANPLKWNMQNLLGAFSGIGSGLATSYATGATNSYIDNYNNKPALGASAIGEGSSTNPFVRDYNYSFKDDPANVYADPESSGLGNGDIATIGAFIGTTSGMLNEFSVLQFYNATPKGKFAVNYNGTLRYWSESFVGGTRGNISNSFVQAAKNSSNSVKFVSKLGSFASNTGTVLSYYGAAEEFVNGSYAKSGAEATSSTVSLALTAKGGNIVGLSWSFGWELGRFFTNTDFYSNWYRNTWHPYRFETLGY